MAKEEKNSEEKKKAEIKSEKKETKKPEKAEKKPERAEEKTKEEIEKIKQRLKELQEVEEAEAEELVSSERISPSLERIVRAAPGKVPRTAARQKPDEEKGPVYSEAKKEYTEFKPETGNERVYEPVLMTEQKERNYEPVRPTEPSFPQEKKGGLPFERKEDEKRYEVSRPKSLDIATEREREEKEKRKYRTA